MEKRRPPGSECRGSVTKPSSHKENLLGQMESENARGVVSLRRRNFAIT